MYNIQQNIVRNLQSVKSYNTTSKKSVILPRSPLNREKTIKVTRHLIK